jgi:beta-lactamase regulating signal transducer with metallopeptidase domain
MMPVLPLDAAWTGWLAGLLLHACWLAAAAGALAWLALYSVRDPRLRHAIALGAIGLVAVGLLVAGIATWPEMRAVLPLAKAGAMPAWTPAAPPMMTTASPVTVAAVAERDWQPWIVLAWSLGVAFVAARHALGYARVLALRRSALPADADLLARVGVRCRAVGLAMPLVLLSSRILVPAATGWWRPALLLPASLLTALPPAQVEALILHELAHLRRRDALVEAGLSAMECLLFFHPAVWWLGRQLREAREQCCDQEALRAGAAPEGLARALLALAESAVAPAPALAATGGALAGRVRRILGAPERHRGRARGLIAVLLLPFLLSLVAACTSREETAIQPMSLASGMVSGAGPDRSLALARRIRARADGRQMTTSTHLISGDAAFWAGVGLSGDGQQVLSAEEAARILGAAEATGAAAGQHTNLNTLPLQQAHAAFLKEYVYIADYGQVDGKPDPIIKTLSIGNTVELCVEPGNTGGAVLVSMGYHSMGLLGAPIANCDFQVADGQVRSYPIEEPVLLAGEARLQQPDITLAAGQALALPVRRYVQRETSTCRARAKSVVEGAPVVVPDLASLPRQMLIVQVQSADAPNRQAAAASRLFIQPGAAAWLDACRVSIEARDEALPAVLDRLAAQLPVPISLQRDPDNAATRVSISASDEALAAVLFRLMPQTLLDAAASPVGLRLFSDGLTNFPAPALGIPASSGKTTTTADMPSDMLAWPLAGEPPTLRMYDVTDVLAQATRSTQRSEAWDIVIDPPSRAADYADGDALVRHLKQLVPATAWGDGRGISIRNAATLFVQAAPAVHRLIEASLEEARRTLFSQVSMQVDLYDGTARQLLGSDRVRILDAAAEDRLLGPGSGAMKLRSAPLLTVRNGSMVILRTKDDARPRVLQLSVQPQIAGDGRSMTLLLDVRLGHGKVSYGTVQVEDGGSILVGSGLPEIILLRAKALRFDVK